MLQVDKVAMPMAMSLPWSSRVASSHAAQTQQWEGSLHITFRSNLIAVLRITIW
jgi:hypothetical protein|tara:strand:- start:313 stop:474 length:162 start_codon:yes stop_codon:yes gene_type:complete